MLLLIHQGDQQERQQQLSQPAVEDGTQEGAEVQAEVRLLFRHLHDRQQPGTVLWSQGPPQEGICSQVQTLEQAKDPNADEEHVICVYVHACVVRERMSTFCDGG